MYTNKNVKPMQMSNLTSDKINKLTRLTFMYKKGSINILYFLSLYKGSIG